VVLLKFLTKTLLKTASRGQGGHSGIPFPIGMQCKCPSLLWIKINAHCSAAQSDYADASHCPIEHGSDVSHVRITMWPLRLALGYHHVWSDPHWNTQISERFQQTAMSKINDQYLLLCAAVVYGLEELAERSLEHGCNPDAEA